MSSIEENLIAVRRRVNEAAERADRDPSSVRIIGVSKTVGRDAVNRAYAAGLRDFGENRVPDALAKFSDPLPADATLHLIGYLQTNKARDAISLFPIIHSVDRPHLIEALEHRAAAAGKPVKVMIQVNIAGEEQKHGCEPEQAFDLAGRIIEAENLDLIGLMTIAPQVDDAEMTRPVFSGLRELRDELQQRLGHQLPELSMGMTNDFEVAVAEGATMVRVGRAIFVEN
ncbi:MAG TPA: YggS family pyridoxal phosphate-dependent enzyme [Thermomicrobiaceae bacterium]|nr:YggS family pyridoxal phosphate-dependent enzyme [Thermomicrobiaceae bacterium]